MSDFFLVSAVTGETVQRIDRICDDTSEIHRGVIARSLGRHGAAVCDLHC